MQIPVSTGAGVSTMEMDAPATVYQTRVNSSGVQDSATPLMLTMRLSDHALAAITKAQTAGQELSTILHGAIRRFDLNELEAFDDATGCMLGLRLPQQTFVFDFRPSAGVLNIHVHRKELPVSRSYGETPMVFVFFIVPANEVVVTRQFFVASKQPKPAAAAKAPKAPKRVRAAPPRRPAPAPATAVETAINTMLSSAKRSRAVGRTDAGATASASAPPPLASPTLAALLSPVADGDVLDDLQLPAANAGVGAGSSASVASPAWAAAGLDGLDSPTVAAGGAARFSIAMAATDGGTDGAAAAPTVVDTDGADLLADYLDFGDLHTML